MKYKSFPTEVKARGERIIEMVISTGDVDRDGDIIEPSGWVLDAFKQNPVVLWAHDHKQPPVAKTLMIAVRGDKLVSTAEFPKRGTYPLADTVFDLLKGGFLNASSVGFMPIEWKPLSDGGMRFTKTELLEWSIVSVPTNATALVMARAKGINVTPILRWSSRHGRDPRGSETIRITGFGDDDGYVTIVGNKGQRTRLNRRQFKALIRDLTEAGFKRGLEHAKAQGNYAAYKVTGNLDHMPPWVVGGGRGKPRWAEDFDRALARRGIR